MHTYFAVWHPAAYSEPYPDYWIAENAVETSTTVAGEHGAIQITKIPYNRAYCEDLEAPVLTFWAHEYIHTRSVAVPPLCASRQVVRRAIGPAAPALSFAVHT